MVLMCGKNLINGSKKQVKTAQINAMFVSNYVTAVPGNP